MAEDPLQALVNLREAVQKALGDLGLTVRMFAPIIEGEPPHALQIVCSMDPERLGKTAEQVDKDKADAAAMAEMEESFRNQDHEQKATETRESAERLLGKLRKGFETPDA